MLCCVSIIQLASSMQVLKIYTSNTMKGPVRLILAMCEDKVKDFPCRLSLCSYLVSMKMVQAKKTHWPPWTLVLSCIWWKDLGVFTSLCSKFRKISRLDPGHIYSNIHACIYITRSNMFPLLFVLWCIVVRGRRRDGLERMSQQQKNKKTKKVCDWLHCPLDGSCFLLKIPSWKCLSFLVVFNVKIQLLLFCLFWNMIDTIISLSPPPPPPISTFSEKIASIRPKYRLRPRQMFLMHVYVCMQQM